MYVFEHILKNAVKYINQIKWIIITNFLMNEPREWLRLKRNGLEDNPGHSDVESRNFSPLDYIYRQH